MPYSLFKEYDKATLLIYLNMLCRCNFGNISLFREELLSKNLVNSIRAGADLFNDAITLEVNVDCREPNDVIDLIKNKINNLEISEDDLIRRKRCNIASMIKDYDDIEYVNTDMAYQMVTYGHIIDDMFDRYNSINMKDMKDIMKKMDLSNNSTVLLVPIKKDS